MLLKIVFRERLAFFSKVFLHCGVDGKLFADGVASEVPDEHVAPFYFVVGGGAGFEVLVAGVEVEVVLADGF